MIGSQISNGWIINSSKDCIEFEKRNIWWKCFETQTAGKEWPGQLSIKIVGTSQICIVLTKQHDALNLYFPSNVLF